MSICPMKRSSFAMLVQLFCACSPASESSNSVPMQSAVSDGAAAVRGSAGTPGVAVSPPIAGVPALATAGAPASVVGSAGKPASTTLSAGRSGGVAGKGMPAVAGMPAAAGSVAAPGDDLFAADREACVEYINMYRATRMLAPLKRATPEQEKCSDDGAKKDGDSMKAHGSAGSCKGLGSQNTCPGYPVRAGGTVSATLKGCLDQMWAEGEPPNGVQACTADRNGCYQMHGHWINMTSSSITTVACGFYKMENGRYWMNQNFGR